jgi:aldose 1-epimerase
MQVEKSGEFEGRRIDEFRLRSNTGVEVDILNWGVVVRDWRVPVKGGKRSVVLGFDQFEPYPKQHAYLGSVAGRVANRIKDATFVMDGRTYKLDGNWNGHTLHGGTESMGRLVWDGEPLGDHAVRFTLHSPDGHMGFPGNVDFTATYTLSDNRLKLELAAVADRKTPISLVQHQYFNLGTGADVLDHTWQVNAPAYTEARDLIATGAILPVDGTNWDLRKPRNMRDASGNPIEYDGNVVLAQDRDLKDPVATVTAPAGDLTLKLWTDRPGLQVYNGIWTDIAVGGRTYGKYSGFCLEDQHFPDTVNHAHYPPIWYWPGKDYAHWCEIEIA